MKVSTTKVQKKFDVPKQQIQKGKIGDIQLQFEQKSDSDEENFENFGSKQKHNQPQNQWQKFDPESSDEEMPQQMQSKKQIN